MLKRLALFTLLPVVGFLGLAAYLGSHMSPQPAKGGRKFWGAGVRTHAVRSTANGPSPHGLIAHTGYRSMALPDFVLDQDRLIGEKVRLSGLYQQIQDVTILAATEDDPNPVDLDISKLPRQVRSELLNCPDRECTFQVEGTVQRHHGSIEILADYAQKVPGD